MEAPGAAFGGMECLFNFGRQRRIRRMGIRLVIIVTAGCCCHRRRPQAQAAWTAPTTTRYRREVGAMIRFFRTSILATLSILKITV